MSKDRPDNRTHEERLEVMQAEIKDGPRTPFEVSGSVFRETLTLYEQCFALAETLAHLDHLVHEGRTERIEDRASSSGPPRPRAYGLRS